MGRKRQLRLTEAEREAVAADANAVALCSALNSPNARRDPDVPHGAQPVSPLLYWAMLGNTGQLKIALHAGEDPNAAGDFFSTRKYTPLHAAAQHGHLEAVRLLVESGAEVNVRLGNRPGETPLDLAASRYHPDVAAYLRERGGRSHTVLGEGVFPPEPDADEREGDGPHALIPDRCLETLRAAGLLVGKPLPADDERYPAGVMIGKPVGMGGNRLPDWRMGWDGWKIDAMPLIIHGENGRWIVRVEELLCLSEPPDQPRWEFDDPDDAVQRVLDYYFGDPSLMEAERRAQEAWTRKQEERWPSMRGGRGRHRANVITEAHHPPRD
jgi:hypothetical protein